MALISLEYLEPLNNSVEKHIISFSDNLLKEGVNPASLFVIKVEGESMQPLIPDGSYVVADLSQKNLKHNDIYIVERDNRLWIKQAFVTKEHEKFVSINHDYAHLEYEKESVRVVAKVVLHFHAF